MVQYLRQLQGYVLRLDNTQRVQLAGLSVAVFAALFGLWFWSSQVAYRVVLSNEDPMRIQEGVRALGEAGIEVVQNADGSVSVPQPEFARAWAALATARVYPTMDDIGKMGIGYTSEQLRIGVERQKRGEMAQAIEQMNGVMRAIVFIDEPKRAHRLFNPDKGTASVNLVPYPGVQITPDVVEAVANLVGSSVRGISAEDVTVTSNARVLKSGATHGPNDDQTMARKRESIETSLVAKASEVLAFMGDPTLYSVAAHVELSTETETIQESRIDIESPAPRRQVTRETEAENTRQGGVPGVDGTLPEREAEGEDGEQERRTEGNEEVLFDYPTTVVHRERPAGSILRQNLSITLDAEALSQRAEASGIETSDLLKQLEDAIQSATGMDATRGDTVRIAMFAFAAPPAVTPEAIPIASQISPWMPYAIQLLAMALAFVLLRPVIRSVTRAPTRIAIDGTAAGAGTGAAGGGVGSPEDSLADRLRGMVDDFESVDSTQLNTLIDRESEASAEVIKLWANEA